LKKLMNKVDAPEKTGESWEISAVENSLSVVANGFLNGNTIEEIAEIYMGDLLGDSVYEKFGPEFPLLIKLIDANDILSIQVHPDDKLAASRHSAYGKTEMWHIIDSDPGSSLFSGFKQEMSKESYLEAMKNGNIKDFLNEEKAGPGDTFYIPAGRVHATGAGILFAEIQQTSDITYRIYDWDRVDVNGTARDLHTDLAVDAIDYKHHADYRTHYSKNKNQANELVSSPYFTVNYFPFDQVVDFDYQSLDSFVIYICLKGACKVEFGNSGSENLQTGETILIPAALKNIRVNPSVATEILEVYINNPVTDNLS